MALTNNHYKVMGIGKCHMKNVHEMSTIFASQFDIEATGLVVIRVLKVLKNG